MKKLVSLLMVFTLVIISLVGVSFGQINLDKVLDYDEVLALAIENSNALETIDSRILIAERNLRSAEHRSDVVNTSSVVSDSQYLENGLTKDYEPSVKKRELEDLKDQKRDLLKDFEIEVIKKVNDFNNKLKEISFYEEKLSTSKQQLENKKAEFEVGRITKNDLYEYEILVEDSQLELANAKRAYQKALITINKLIGYPLNTEVVLINPPDLAVEALDYDLDLIVEKAMENSPEAVNAYHDLQLKELQWSVVRRFSRYSKPENFQDIEEEVEDYKEAYEDAKITGAVNAWSDYLNLLTDKDNYEISKMDYELAAKKLEVAETKYELGMITYLEYRQAQDTLKAAENDMKDLKLTLYTNKLDFDYYLEKLEWEYENIIIK